MTTSTNLPSSGVAHAAPVSSAPKTATLTPFVLALKLADEISKIGFDTTPQDRVAITYILQDAVTDDRRNVHGNLIAALEDLLSLAEGNWPDGENTSCVQRTIDNARAALRS